MVRVGRIAGLLAACAALYAVGVFTGTALDLDLVADNRQLRTIHARLAAELASAEVELGRERRQAQLAELLTEQLRVELDKLVSERADLRREIDFYLRFVDRAGNLEGIQVQDLVVARRPDGSGYWYRLVLVQNPRSGEVVTGVAKLRVEAGGDSPEALATARADYEFRYFQLLEGTFELTESLRPATVKVDILPAGGIEADAVSVSFPWQATS